LSHSIRNKLTNAKTYAALLSILCFLVLSSSGASSVWFQARKNGEGLAGCL